MNSLLLIVLLAAPFIVLGAIVAYLIVTIGRTQGR